MTNVVLNCRATGPADHGKDAAKERTSHSCDMTNINFQTLSFWAWQSHIITDQTVLSDIYFQLIGSGTWNETYSICYLSWRLFQNTKNHWIIHWDLIIYFISLFFNYFYNKIHLIFQLSLTSAWTGTWFLSESPLRLLLTWTVSAR